MSIDCKQLREFVIVPTITALGLYSPSAVQLLLGTIANESQMGQFIKQKGGPALGILQIEKPTFNDIWDRMVTPNVATRAKMRLLLGYEMKPPAERMITDLALSVAMARLLYYSNPVALPAVDDIAGMAAFYKRWFNTVMGKATEQEFIDNYHKYVQ